MNLREFFSNKIEIYKMFGDNPTQMETKFLVIKWDLLTDQLAIVFPPFIKEAPTKRVALGYAARVFDPMGVVCPTLVWIKHLIQSLWKRGWGWDEVFDAWDGHDWMEFFDDFSGRTIEIPRLLPIPLEDEMEMHVFCDASTEAYWCCVYLRAAQARRAGLVFARSRIRPLKMTTIPRLELLAVVIGVRAITNIKTEISNMKVTKQFLWSDCK